MADADTARRTALAFGLAVLSVVLLGAGLAAGSEGWSPAEAWRLATSPDGPLLIGQIRAPTRTCSARRRARRSVSCWCWAAAR